MILMSNIEYMTLRVIRKFLFNHRIVSKLKKVIPYYDLSEGQVNPEKITDSIVDALEKCLITIDARSILEIGCGATTGTGYELVARFDAEYKGYDPYTPFNRVIDSKQLLSTALRYGKMAESIQKRACRISSIEEMHQESIDLIFSNAVLEHVNNMASLTQEMWRVLKPKGCMVHFVDYRDHFFKYPYHFLQFSTRTWDALLNPGDLPRYRICDHVNIFSRNGFKVTVVAENCESGKFDDIKPYINKEFRHVTEHDLSISSAVLFCEKT